MPELPDIVVYIHALERKCTGHQLKRVQLLSPFVLRSVTPSTEDIRGLHLTGVSRLGKRIVLELENEIFIVIHLMIAGRLHWKPIGTKTGGKINLAAFEFDNGTLLFTEASSKKRASITFVSGREGLQEHHRGGLEPLESDLPNFFSMLTSENHTLKRALTDPHLFSGIGNAYSDEILHRAQLSPMKLTSRLTEEEMSRLYVATVSILREWIDRLTLEVGDGFPDKVTAFRKEMAVHGKYGQPCPVCGSAVQRIAYADNECNYCVTCQTDGKLSADRGLSRLMKGDWPKSLSELEDRKAKHGST